MKKAIKNLEIKNFKSIRHVELECGRINIFIGKPNVGKSNILEALSLYNVPKVFSIKDFIRFNTFDNLFHYRSFNNPIDISSELGSILIKYLSESEDFGLFISKTKNFDEILINGNSGSVNMQIGQIISDKGLPEMDLLYYSSFDNMGKRRNEKLINPLEVQKPVRKYLFHKEKSVSNFNQEDVFLTPPYGTNLTSILESNKELQDEISSFFKEYDLEFVLDRFNKKIEVQRRIENFVDKIPYNLTADTLQRIIFHYAAIESNKDSILLFEEPENHSFPPYIRSLAEKIVESKDNQFFITTHSPYLFNTLISDTKKGEVAVFITTFDNHETKVKKLSEEELSKILDYGVDVFFNLKHFENE